MEEKPRERKDSDEISEGNQNVFRRFNRLCGCTLELFYYKVVFFSCYGAFACLLTFLSLYFKQLGLSAFQTGILVGIRPLCQAIGAPFWGILADKYKQRKAILLLGASAWVIKNMLILAVRPSHEVCVVKPVTLGNESSTLLERDALVFSRPNDTRPSMAASTSPPLDKHKYFVQVDSGELSDTFHILLALVLVGELFGSIVHPVLDGCMVDYLGDERTKYGRIRVWASVGMVLASVMAGLIINHYTYQFCGETRKHYAIAFYIFASFMAVMIIFVFFVKIVYSETPKQSQSGIKDLFNSRPKSSFWFVAIAIGMSDGFSGDFNSWFLDDLNATSFQVGLAASLSFMVSALFFFIANYILEALGYAKTIAFSMALYAVVLVCYSFTHNPWVALALHSTSGGVFAVKWTACVAYVGSISTAIGLGAAAQGILNGLFVGVGNGSGTMLGGFLVSKIGIRWAYRLFAAFLVLVIFLFLACQWQRENTDETSYRAVPSKEENTDE